MRKQHATAISSIGVKPHALSISNRPQIAHRIDRARICRTEDAYYAHRSYSMFVILGDRRLERIQLHPKFGIGRQCTQRTSTQPNSVDSLIDRNVPLFRRINRPALLNSIVLYPILRHAVPSQLETDEVSHHPAAGKVPSSLVVVADHVGKPFHRLPLHGHSRWTDRVSTNILVKRRTDEIRNDANGIGRRSNQPHVTWMSDMRAIRKKRFFKFLENRLGSARFHRQRLVKELRQFTWLHVRKHRLFFDVLQILS